MNNNGVWANPDDFLMVFRCTEAELAENFVEKGQIKFSTPRSWVEYAEQYGDGRGDKLEGTIATFNILDIDNAIHLMKKYEHHWDLEGISIGQRVYLKKKRDMELPCFCFYIFKNSMFECPQEEGVHKLTAIVPASYFRDFANNFSPEQVEKLDPKKRPAVIFISDYPEFERRLIAFLTSLGVKREEIIITRIEYFDFEKYGDFGWWDFGQKPPMELSIKHIRFRDQSEARIIINTDSIDIKKILEQPIEIGPLTDIASWSNKYLYDGAEASVTVSIEVLNHET